ncbi:MAG: GTPase Era [bacterium]
MIDDNFISGYVSIVGKPNAGKSTLLNSIIDFPLSSTSQKPQMTRHRILGILNGDDYQVIFVDTPGIIKPRYKLQKVMVKQIKRSLSDSDLSVLVVEPNQPYEVDSLRLSKKPVILAINKIDKVKNKKELLPLTKQWMSMHDFTDVVMISAKEKINLDQLTDKIVSNLPYGPRYFDKNTITDRNQRFYCGEIIRETAYDIYHQEIPYALSVLIDDFKERSRGKYFIQATIFLESKSQKLIVIGRGGQSIKKLGILSREKIEQFIGHQVYLEIKVKIMEKWRKKTESINKLGYGG